jgi:hypothetical protein
MKKVNLAVLLIFVIGIISGPVFSGPTDQTTEATGPVAKPVPKIKSKVKKKHMKSAATTNGIHLKTREQTGENGTDVPTPREFSDEQTGEHGGGHNSQMMAEEQTGEHGGGPVTSHASQVIDDRSAGANSGSWNNAELMEASNKTGEQGVTGTRPHNNQGFDDQSTRANDFGAATAAH